MPLSISAEVQQLVEQECALGDYQSPDDVLLEAVWLLRDRNEKLRELRRAILPALESLNRGEGRPLDMARIKAEASKRFDEVNANPADSTRPK
jgi:Arc/MetJ-type ribon-helix-helix transcriptional regulator